MKDGFKFTFERIGKWYLNKITKRTPEHSGLESSYSYSTWYYVSVFEYDEISARCHAQGKSYFNGNKSDCMKFIKNN